MEWILTPDEDFGTGVFFKSLWAGGYGWYKWVSLGVEVGVFEVGS